MIKLLAKIFIKDSKNYQDVNVRRQYGILCGGFGIFLNIILFILKFVFGTIAASVAMIADAFNNLSDAASSLISILGFKLASKKPDPEHPFGHGRLEYVSGLVISFLILMMGVELFKSSIESLIHPEKTSTSIISIIIMCIAILVKLYMYFYNHSVAKKIKSVSMEATAKDSFSDMISTLVVIASIIAGQFTSFPVDGAAGIIVALFILYTGFDSARETVKPLLGQAPSKEFVNQIKTEVMAHSPIIGIHDLVVHDYGPGRVMISLHAEVPGDVNIFDLHDVIDNAEKDVSEKLNCSVTIHMDPIDIKNERVVELRAFLKTTLIEIDPELNCHDVRIVPGRTHTNLVFDVLKPYNCKKTDEELKEQIQTAVKNKFQDVKCVITIDNPYV